MQLIACYNQALHFDYLTRSRLMQCVVFEVAGCWQLDLYMGSMIFWPPLKQDHVTYRNSIRRLSTSSINCLASWTRPGGFHALTTLFEYVAISERLQFHPCSNPCIPDLAALRSRVVLPFCVSNFPGCMGGSLSRQAREIPTSSYIISSYSKASDFFFFFLFSLSCESSHKGRISSSFL